jgi:hypothetical protein
LPIMSWKADYASEVVKTLDQQWMDINNHVHGSLNPINLGVTQITLESGDKKPVITITGGPKTTFDIVVIAIGF